MANEAKKYRLGNQPEEYEIKKDYLGWNPETEDWEYLLIEYKKNINIVIVSPAKEKKTLFLHRFISKDAFPDFFDEEISEKWYYFAIVSETEASEKFIIPLH